MACILSVIVRIEMKILHDIDKVVLLIVTKFRNDTTSHISAVNKYAKKYAILQWTN